MSTTFADRALVFLETGSLPDGFTPITTALPTDDKPVVALRKSSYSGAKFEVITARYMPAYRPLSPWRDLSLDSVHDDGEPILGWREAPEWLQG